MSEANSRWLATGVGRMPELRWSFRCEAPLVQIALAREAGELLVADVKGTLYRLDRRGELGTVRDDVGEVRALATSDTAEVGACLVGDRHLCRFDEHFHVTWWVEFTVRALDVAVDPYGRVVAVSLEDGTNLIFTCNRKRLAEFSTMRPLRFLRFLATEPTLVGAAEYGLLCAHDLRGELIWSEPSWTNVGDISVTGDGQTLLVAGFSHGLQAFDDAGTIRGVFAVDGTARRVSSSFTAHRIAVATQERQLYWLERSGSPLWSAEAPEPAVALACDPLGGGFVCGLESGQILRLDWTAGGPQPA